MSAPARINLVRAQTLAQSDGLGVGSTQHDEVELLTPAGESAVMVAGGGYQNSDITYEYVNGGLGSAVRRMRHRIQMNVDWIGDSVRQKLERWKRDRALVLFCPGYGRHTDFAYRPLLGNGSNCRDGTTALKDLTGRHNLTHLSTTNPVWDRAMRSMRAFSGTNPRRVLPTPAGSGLVAHRFTTNRMPTPTPGSGTPGWTAAGTHSADLTIAHVAYGFGHTTAPHSFRVTAADAANRLRWLQVGAWGGYTFTGNLPIQVSIWMRGRVGTAAAAHLSHDGAVRGSVNIGALDLTEWTKVSFTATSADWASNASIPSIAISFVTGAADGNVNLEVGPTMVSHGGITSIQTEWVAAAGNEDRTSVASYRFPAAGSVIVSFWVPEGAAGDNSTWLMFPQNDAGIIGVTATGVRVYYRSGATIDKAVSLNEGGINTIAYAWGTSGPMRLYFNGVEVGDSGADYDIEIADTAGYLRLAYSWPMVPLTYRIERRTWTAADIAAIDTTLRNHGANAICVHARGRKYRVVQVPDQMRNQSGGVAWVGPLVLEEYEYDHNLADLISEEP